MWCHREIRAVPYGRVMERVRPRSEYVVDGEPGRWARSGAHRSGSGPGAVVRRGYRPQGRQADRWLSPDVHVVPKEHNSRRSNGKSKEASLGSDQTHDVSRERCVTQSTNDITAHSHSISAWWVRRRTGRKIESQLQRSLSGQHQRFYNFCFRECYFDMSFVLRAFLLGN